MKKFVSLCLSIFILFGSASASANKWINHSPNGIRPDREIEIINLFVDVVIETFEGMQETDEMDFDLSYFGNVDILTGIITLKRISKHHTSKSDLKALQSEMEVAMTKLRDTWRDTLGLLGVKDIKIVLFCNSNDFDDMRIAEVWDESINSSNNNK